MPNKGQYIKQVPISSPLFSYYDGVFENKLERLYELVYEKKFMNWFWPNNFLLHSTGDCDCLEEARRNRDTSHHSTAMYNSHQSTSRYTPTFSSTGSGGIRNRNFNRISSTDNGNMSMDVDMDMDTDTSAGPNTVPGSNSGSSTSLRTNASWGDGASSANTNSQDNCDSIQANLWCVRDDCPIQGILNHGLLLSETLDNKHYLTTKVSLAKVFGMAKNDDRTMFGIFVCKARDFIHCGDNIKVVFDDDHVLPQYLAIVRVY